jgi:hypothetical protein
MGTKSGKGGASDKPTPEQIVKELEAQARDDEAVEKLASMSDADLEKELAGAGFDVAEEKEAAQAFRQKLEQSAAARRAELAAKTAPTPPRKAPMRRRPWAGVAAGAAAAAGAIGIYAASVGPVVTGGEPDVATLRRDGLAACAAHDWLPCLDKLDRARKVDPEGDLAADVQQARRAADEALHPKR